MSLTRMFWSCLKLSEYLYCFPVELLASYFPSYSFLHFRTGENFSGFSLSHESRCLIWFSSSKYLSPLYAVLLSLGKIRLAMSCYWMTKSRLQFFHLSSYFIAYGIPCLHFKDKLNQSSCIKLLLSRMILL